MSVRVASSDPSAYANAIVDHARRVADGLRRLSNDDRVALVNAWLKRARAIRTAVQSAERAVQNRRRSKPATRDELVLEVFNVAGGDTERGVAAARAYLASAPAGMPPHVITGAVMWVAAESSIPRLSSWPLANAEHVLVSAGMYGFGSSRFLPLHVAVLALLKLGHSGESIAVDLGIDAREVRRLKSTHQI